MVWNNWIGTSTKSKIEPYLTPHTKAIESGSKTLRIELNSQSSYRKAYIEHSKTQTSIESSIIGYQWQKLQNQISINETVSNQKNPEQQKKHG